MKVLHFFKTYYPDSNGGIEQVIYQISEGVVSADIESHVLYLSKRGTKRNEVIDNHTSHSAKLDLEFASTGFSVSAFFEFKRLAEQVDIIHYHFPWPFMDVVHFATKVKKPCLVSYHSDIVKQKSLLKVYEPLMHKFLSSVDMIISACPNYVDSSSVLQQYASKVQVIPYGLDPSTYPEPSKHLLEGWKKRVGERFFLFVGGLRYYKGLEYLLEAVKITNLPVVIAGQGGLENQLKEQAKTLGLSNVTFVGGVDDEDKVALLQLCSAFVFPSHLRSEAFGISLLEAAMYSKPMISCEIGTGTTYVNIANETGLVVPPADSNALANAMSILWEDPKLAKMYGANAKTRFDQLFTSERMASSYTNIYKELFLKK